MFSVTPKPGLSGTSRYPSFICGASSNRFWPSCQIQCVSSAVGFPDAAAATCANVVSVMSKWLFEWLPHVSPQSFRIDAIRSLDKRGHLRISTTSQWGLEMITSITSRFKEAFPEVTFELFQANADNLKKMLETEAIDFALMSVGSREELTENYELLQEEELFFAVPASHPYCRQNPGAELSEEELIRSFSCTHLLLSKKGTANRTLADKIFSRYPHGLSSVSEVNGMTMTRELVAQGVGAAFIPTSCRQEEARIHYYALRPRLVRYNVLVYRKNLVLNQPEQFFHSCVVNYYS